MANAVFGIAGSEFQAEAIVNELRVARFADLNISVLLADKAGASASPDKINGATLGWLAGIQSIAIPGMGPFIATGPILDALNGAAVGSSPRAIMAALTGMGLSVPDARRFEQKVRVGNLLIAVHSETADETSRAEAIFAQAAAQDVTVSKEASFPAPEPRSDHWKL